MNATTILGQDTVLDSLSAMVRRARAAFPSWRALSVSERSRCLQGLKHLIYKRRNEIAGVLVSDSARVQFSAEGLIFEVLNTFSIAAAAEQILCRPQRVRLNPLLYRSKTCTVRYEPYGVVGIISPSNSPFFESFQQIIQAVLMGNTVVVKPSERTPQVAQLIADLVAEAGLPAGIVNIALGGTETGAWLCACPEVAKIVIYGTLATGQRAASAAAQTIKPLVLGLGGNEAAIVLEDAQLRRAAQGIIYGAFCNAGQTCSCTRRVFALNGIMPALTRELVAGVKQLRLTGLVDPRTEIGAVKKPEDARALLQAAAEAQAQGAVLLCGGMHDETNCRVSPIIFGGCRSQMRIMQEEFMAPYLCLCGVDSENEAIALANESRYGLTASVWTQNTEHGQRIARQLQVGTVWINDSQFYHFELPYGGIKQSGYGKTCGREGLLEYVFAQLICAETSSEPGFAWFPYSEKKLRLMRQMMAIKHAPTRGERLRAFLGLFTR